ncbi:MAG: ASKHA domain-containing protein [Eubacteriales bacterium]|jgi:uncharacterized 2Fe-2S/4Fe-4S cluster protein (DUF4445 family)
MKITIQHQNISTTTEYRQPVKLSTVITENGISFDMPCGGKGRCGKCKVQAVGELSPLTEKERETLTPEELAAGVRLACVTDAMGDCTVILPEKKKMDGIVSTGCLPAFQPDPGEGYGMAVDIGTTTVVVYLYDLQNGSLVGQACARNPQSAFGADVISRIEKSLAGEGERLAEAIRTCIDQLLNEICEKHQIKREQVARGVITGNTAMLYLLMNHPTDSIATAPFEMDEVYGRWMPAQEVGIELEKDAQIYLTRCIAAFVGGDITSAILACDICDKPENSLMVDIGTNGEMALKVGEKLLCCSTAAGPAFEGAGIYMGMNGVDGAVSKVWLENGKLAWEVIGGGAATGICGSGIIDAVATLLEMGVIDETGVLDEENETWGHLFTEVEDSVAFRLGDSGVVITQQDIRAIQLAKSAICAGMETLIRHCELNADQLDHLYIAGGFGSFLNVRNAERIGLIPGGFADKSIVVGNAAGMGATAQLLSSQLLHRSEEIARQARNVELSTDPYFMDRYVDGMMFEA